MAQGDDLRLKLQAALELGTNAGKQKRIGCTWREESVAMEVGNINKFKAGEISSVGRSPAWFDSSGRA